ncbi:MAG: adenylyltransferase/cytidyltransferase family protein [Candidatus Bipolaricaulota bacterium]|nr:adenylyltransferase/cytidyltransferase family protein [Candidatus Bipolaricaulota bacterium]MDW8126711.1 riboflavin kinase [Candidatus Bipolaricaulota bacterium]
MFRVVTVGRFDGVHLGHQRLLSYAKSLAEERGWCALAYTFPPEPPALLPLAAKVRLLKELVDEVEVVEWEKVRDLSAGEFLQKEVVGRLSGRALVMGPDHRFGRGREGDVSFARSFSQILGIEVHVISPVKVGNDIVSSRRVRELLQLGEVGKAVEILGRPPVLFGQRVAGAGLAKTLGFPTINLVLDPILARPKDGVYLAWTFWAGGDAPGLFYHGKRLTFPNLPPSAEIHLLSAPPNPLPEAFEVHLLKFLREDIRFPSPESLVKRISEDVVEAKNVLSALTPPRPILLGV